KAHATTQLSVVNGLAFLLKAERVVVSASNVRIGNLPDSRCRECVPDLLRGVPVASESHQGHAHHVHSRAGLPGLAVHSVELEAPEEQGLDVLRVVRLDQLGLFFHHSTPMSMLFRHRCRASEGWIVSRMTSYTRMRSG